MLSYALQPVSYTHLDVYKRQVLYFIKIIFETKKKTTRMHIVKYSDFGVRGVFCKV